MKLEHVVQSLPPLGSVSTEISGQFARLRELCGNQLVEAKFEQLLRSVAFVHARGSAGEPLEIARDLANQGSVGLAGLEAAVRFGGLVKIPAVIALTERAGAGDIEAKKIVRSLFSNAAIYAGSFDPFTLGHRDIAERAARIFEKVYVDVGINPGKSPLFSREEKIDMIRHDLQSVPGNFEVGCFSSLLASRAHEMGVRTIIRGVRDTTDLNFEIQQASANRLQSGNEDLETCILLARPEYSNGSSTNVRAIASYRFGDISSYVTPYTERRVKEKVQIKELKSRWEELFAGTTSDRGIIDEEFAKVVAAYGSANRHHHNLEHIFDMSKLLDEAVREDASGVSVAVRELRAAIFFHDIVYVPGATDNEAVSAEIALESLTKLGWASDEIAHVKRLIVATAKHQVDPEARDCALFLDIDLSILGANATRYQRYVEGIKNEFVPPFTEEEFQKGRPERFLKPFLARPSIFFTDGMQARFEAAAQRNLAEELKASLV